jgi:hypothetical protein
MLGTFAYLKEHNLSLAEYNDYLGRRFALDWSQDLSAKQCAQHISRIWASLGAEIRSVSASESQAEIVVANWPQTDWLEMFGLIQEEADSAFDVGKPLFGHLGFGYEWSRQGDEVTMTLSR